MTEIFTEHHTKS